MFQKWPSSCGVAFRYRGNGAGEKEGAPEAGETRMTSQYLDVAGSRPIPEHSLDGGQNGEEEARTLFDPANMLRAIHAQFPRNEHLPSTSQPDPSSEKRTTRLTSVLGGSPSKRFCPNNEGSSEMSASIRSSISGVRSARGRSSRAPAAMKT
mgnify:FL=1